MIIPSCWNGFQCVADRCTHSCCIGWEIDIDEETLKLYDKLPGEFGAKVRGAIDRRGTPCFKMDESERCPFLNERNLCDIILTQGENAICQICTDHPRFYNDYADVTECGLGLCCEEACKMLLEKESSFHEINCESKDVEYIALFEERRGILEAILQGYAAKDVIKKEFNEEAKAIDSEALLDFLLGLEIMENDWGKTLKKLVGYNSVSPLAVQTAKEDGIKLMGYLVYRYYLHDIYMCEDPIFSLKMGDAFTTILRMVYSITLDEKGILTMSDRINWIRLVSAELEYSEENIEKIRDYLA